MPFRRAIALALLLSPAPLLAQTSFQPVTLSDADALAEQVRRLGANPLDLNALLTAGELSVRLEDLNAAGSFFARAEKIDPRNGRAKAGEAAILVRSERPAEALRYFGYAEGYGYPLARFASDRGLAHDLLGDPGRAQRDYKLALATRDDPETRRRYALSLAIAGRQAQALEQLAPLIRQNDRAAWRSRAFVLAMGGNAAEASRIAQTMMPPGSAAGLASFFAELPRLPATDRAFAVHFGEVRPTPQRLADARLAPQQALLALDPLPVQIAAVPPAPPKKNKRDKRRDRDRRVEVAALAPAAVVAALPSPPVYQTPVYAPYVARTPVRDRPLTAGEQASLAAAGVRNLPTRPSRPSTPTYTAPARTLLPAEQASLAAANGRSPAPVAVASVAPLQVAPPRREPTVLASIAPTPRPGFTAQPVQPERSTPVASAATVPSTTPPAALIAPATPRAPVIVAGLTPTPAQASPVAQPTVALASPAVTRTPGATPPIVAQATPGFSTSPVAPSPSRSVAGPPVPTELAQVYAAPSAGVAPIVGSTAPSPAALASTLAPSTATVDSEPAGLAATTTPVVAPGGSPAIETIAALPPAPVVVAAQPTPVVTPIRPVAVTRAPAPRPRSGRGDADSILAKIVAGLTIPAAELDITPTRATPGEGRPLTAAARRAADRKALADKIEAKPADDKKATAATRKALADKKAAADKKALAAKEAADAKKTERAQPARIWVQVAGGANEAGLASAWKIMKTKAPGVLGGRQAYTTPLRATNRVLTGPFKTDAEARAYVNQLAKKGVNAFTFTSDKGQKITRLDEK